VERTIQREEAISVPVLDREAIMQVRNVCREVLVAPHVQEYAIHMVMATQPDQKEAHELARKYVRYGSTPRGAQALVECDLRRLAAHRFFSAAAATGACGAQQCAVQRFSGAQ
jgi:MoxR-like ATPase